MNPSLAHCLAFFEHGVGYPLPHPPPYYIDLGGARYESVFVNGRLTVTITAPNKGANHSSTGLHFASAGQDIARKHGVDVHDEALRVFAKTHHNEIVEKFKTILFEQGSMRLLGEAGLSPNEMREWNLIEVTAFSMEIGEVVEYTRWERWLPVVIRIQADYKRLPKVDTSPLSDLSDRDLNKVISEHMGPEGITCDGEIPSWRMASRMRELRARYRAYSPRIQTEIWTQFTHSRV